MAPMSAVVALVQTGQRHTSTEEKRENPFMVVMEKLALLFVDTL